MNGRIASGIHCLVLVAFLIPVSCKKENAAPAGDIFTIVTSFYPVYIIARNVAGSIDGVKVINMTRPVTGCLHDYSITSADMKYLEDAGILLVNGAGMESFMDRISDRYPGLKTAEISGGIKLVEYNKIENPHVWVSVSNAIIMTRNCAEVLAAADPAHAAQYRKNAGSYTAKLEVLKKEMDAALAPFRGRSIITFHEAFPYFAQEYGLVIAAVIEREPGSEPSAKELADTIDLVKKSGIKALFTEPQYPSSAADTIAAETGAAVYVLDPAVTGDDSTDAYINIMKKNLMVLEAALR
ncbi:MAG TPA: metal ABC transporter substrate-binding protein [Spirochaetota bacterium]|nr:metal ABC transporter substrate-binding protein [Spirochaetota bacterium]